MKRGEELCKITFNAKNKLGVKFRLTKEFMIPVYTYTNNPDDKYLFTHDSDMSYALSKFCEKEELTWWLDGPPPDVIGGPYWDKICNLRVLDTCDY